MVRVETFLLCCNSLPYSSSILIHIFPFDDVFVKNLSYLLQTSMRNIPLFLNSL